MATVYLLTHEYSDADDDSVYPKQWREIRGIFKSIQRCKKYICKDLKENYNFDIFDMYENDHGKFIYFVTPEKDLIHDTGYNRYKCQRYIIEKKEIIE